MNLHETLTQQAERVEDFLAYHRNQVHCPVYTSVDIRRNRHKMAVVDANAFPAGFNNLAARSHAEASAAIKSYMGRMYPGAKELLLLGESHSRNKWYFQNLLQLRNLFAGAGYDVTVGTLNQELFPQTDVETALGDSLTVHGVMRDGDSLIADGTVHDVVILNNDLSSGSPEILDGIDQPVTPPPSMGWHRRSKSEHFRIVNEMSRQLGEYVGFDPWLITAEFEKVRVDFKSKDGFEAVAAAVDRVLAKTRAKYEEYGINREASVFVKADAGTYGMGITTATSGDQFLTLNSKARDKMNTGKEGVKTTTVIVQEGVPTSIKTGENTAEPVMYMVCGSVVGGFYRVHTGKGDNDNLNSPGSHFEPFALSTQSSPGEDETALDEPTRHLYQVIGEIASIATGYEAKLAVGEALPSYP
ncbi:MAG: glutamate--cysteine ligase [Thermoplasmatota archaeon]